VAEAFLNKTSAWINSDNWVFGDPCYGTVKRLQVVLAYGGSYWRAENAEQVRPGFFVEFDEPVESPPSAPRELSVTSATVTGASISWSAPSDIGEPAMSSYELDVRSTEGAAWTTVATFPAEATSAELRDLPCGQQVQIRLSAMNTVGSSEPSAEIPWESTSTKFQMCPTSPVSAAIGQRVTLSVVGARIHAGYLGTGNVVFTVKGQSLVGEVNANGNASVTFVPSNRGKAAVTASLAQLSPRGQLAKIIKVSGYAWTASFSAPKTALVGQSVQLTGTYVAPGQTVIVSWADGTQSVTADASGTIKVPMKMATRGTQQVVVSQGTRMLFSSFIKVGGKQSTW
jgi:hypothetical protein